MQQTISANYQINTKSTNGGIYNVISMSIFERGYKEYYCELKDEYVDEKTYENHCYGVMAERY